VNKSDIVKAVAKRTGHKVVVRPMAQEIQLIDDLFVASPGGPVITADTPPDQWDPMTKAHIALAAKGGAL